jgi:DNA repair exonuclease SbcCD nuclease subunit
MRRQKRSKNKKADLIIVSDIHLMERQPPARTDDFVSAQFIKLDFISQLQKEHDCDVVCGGDLFDHWKPSPWLIRKTIKHLPGRFHTVYGQHDLQNHNFELWEKSGIAVLEAAGALTVLDEAHWGHKPKEGSLFFPRYERSILVWHKYNYIGKQPWPDCQEPTGHTLLDDHPEFDLIITGDNHIPFVVKKDGRLLVNPGSMTRTKADQIDHGPRVYLWYAEENKVEPVYLPIADDVVSREHIDKKQARDDRLDAFISRLDSEWLVSLNFEDNLKEFSQKNKVSNKVMEVIWDAIEK